MSQEGRIKGCFVVVDVETANRDKSSICQIGAVAFNDGSITNVWEQLVDPRGHFDQSLVELHGITKEAVLGAPTFPEIHPHVLELLNGQIVVSHGPFDRQAFAHAAHKHGLPKLECEWLDSTMVVRRTWPEFAHSGYKLASIAGVLGITFRNHAAGEDARAAGEVLLAAIATTGVPLEIWLAELPKPRDSPIFDPVGNTRPVCPHCGGTLPEMPARKLKCPSCSEDIYVRTRPSGGKRVLVTREQASLIDDQWRIKREAM